MSKKRISVQSAKAKGRRLQQWVAKWLSRITGFPWGQDQPIEPRPMGQPGTDVRLDKEVQEVLSPWVIIECKNQQTWSVPSWIRDIRKRKKKGTEWLLFMKRNHFKPVVVMDAKAFFRLLRRYLKLKAMKE